MNTCFACGRKLGANPKMVDTKEDQAPYVGIECYRKIADAGSAGWQPPKGGPRLYVLTPERRSQLTKKGILTDSVSANDGGKFRVMKDFYAHDFTTGDDVKLRTGQEVTYVNASDKGFIFKLANGHEVHVRRDDADNISSKPVGDSVSPVPIAGKFANGCPFCKANHDPGIPCRNSQPRTGLTKPQKIERDGKLLGVNMVPVGDVSDKCQRCRGTGSIMVRGMDRPERCPMCKGSGKKEAAKATDSITLSHDEARTLLSVLKTTR